MKLKSRINISINALLVIVLMLNSFIIFDISTKHLKSRLDQNINRTYTALCNVVNSKLSEDSMKNQSLNTDTNLLFRNDFSSSSFTYNWNDFFKVKLINSYNYLIRIYDIKSGFIWYSNNNTTFNNDHSFNYEPYEIYCIKDSLVKRPNTPSYLSYYNYEGLLNNTDNLSKITNINNQNYNLIISKYKDFIITVGQPYDFYFDYKYSLIVELSIYSAITILIANLLLFIFLRKPFSIFNSLNEKISLIKINKSGTRVPTDFKYDELNTLSNTINATIEKIENSFTRLSRFSAEVAHELKTPLTILRGELTLALQNEKSTDEYQQTIASALEESIRMTGVVEALLDLARAETGQVKLFKKDVNLSLLMDDVVEDFEILAEDKNIFIKSYIDKDISCNIDAARIRQAILNIVENSIKYTPEKGIITIELSKSHNEAVICISDTGIGIPNDKIHNIFESFYRTDEVKTKNIQGLGLGLTMVKWIIDSHNGVIDVKSKVGEGTLFKIKLPLLVKE